jgi:hypothetical protein
MSQLEQFKQMIDGLPELVRRSLSPKTSVVTECPFPGFVGHTVFELTNSIVRLEFIFNREGKLVDVLSQTKLHRVEAEPTQILEPYDQL